jgi:nickel transport protein
MPARLIPLFFAAHIWITIALLFAPVGALAHKVNVFAYYEGEKIIVEGYFSKDNKARDCPVIFYDTQGNELLKGKTDEKGQFIVEPSGIGPIAGDLTITLNTQDGHKAMYTLPLEEAPPSIKAAQSHEKASDESDHEGPALKQPAERDDTRISYTQGEMDRLEEIIQRIVRNENSKTIQMVSNLQRRMLEQENSGPTLRDIVGGIGWILGLLGIAAYFSSKKNN